MGKIRSTGILAGRAYLFSSRKEASEITLRLYSTLSCYIAIALRYGQWRH